MQYVFENSLPECLLRGEKGGGVFGLQGVCA